MRSLAIIIMRSMIADIFFILCAQLVFSSKYHRLRSTTLLGTLDLIKALDLYINQVIYEQGASQKGGEGGNLGFRVQGLGLLRGQSTKVCIC